MYINTGELDTGVSSQTYFTDDLICALQFCCIGKDTDLQTHISYYATNSYVVE